MRTELLATFGVVSLFCASPAFAADSMSANDEASPRPSIGLTVLGGVAMPSCVGQRGACVSAFEPAPSLRALVLYQPTARWGFGVAGQLAWVDWSASYLPYRANPTMQTIQSDLTAGFAGFAARYTPVPEWRVTPIVELAMGVASQAQTGSNFNCNRGLSPTGQLAVGASARVIPEISVFAMASAMGGFSMSSCDASDGAPATPFAGWGYGFHAGAAFDIGIGAPSTGPSVALRRQAARDP